VVTDLSQIQRKARAVSVPDDPDVAPRSSAGPAVARVLLFLFFVLLVWKWCWRGSSARPVPWSRPTPPWPPRRAIPGADLRPSQRGVFPLLLAALVGPSCFTNGCPTTFSFAPPSWRRGWSSSWASPADRVKARGGSSNYLSYLTGYATADRWLAFALALATGALAAAVYRRERVAARVRVPGDASPLPARSGLIGMRVAIILLTLIVFLPQVRLLFEREAGPDVVILIDTSRSMGKPTITRTRRPGTGPSNWPGLVPPGRAAHQAKRTTKSRPWRRPSRATWPPRTGRPGKSWLSQSAFCPRTGLDSQR